MVRVARTQDQTRGSLTGYGLPAIEKQQDIENPTASQYEPEELPRHEPDRELAVEEEAAPAEAETEAETEGAGVYKPPPGFEPGAALAAEAEEIDAASDLEGAAGWATEFDNPAAAEALQQPAQVLLGETKHFGNPYRVDLPPPEQRRHSRFNRSASTAHIIYDTGGAHMNYQFIFHSVKLVGDAIHVHNFRYTGGGGGEVRPLL
jgi:plasmid stabilization system protein ParE